MTFPSNKKILQLGLKDYIFRSCQFQAKISCIIKAKLMKNSR